MESNKKSVLDKDLQEDRGLAITFEEVDVIEEACSRGYKPPYNIEVIKELTGMKTHQIKAECRRLKIKVERDAELNRLFDEHALRCLYELTRLRNAGVRKIESIKEFLSEKGLFVEDTQCEPVIIESSRENYVDPSVEVAACVEDGVDLQDMIVETISNSVADKLADSLSRDITDIKEMIHSIKKQNAASGANIDIIRNDTKDISNSLNSVKVIAETTDKKIEVLKNSSMDVSEKLDRLNENYEKSEWSLGKIHGYAEKSAETVVVNGERLVDIDGRISNVEERIAAMKEEMERRKDEGHSKYQRGILGRAKGILNILGLNSSPQQKQG